MKKYLVTSALPYANGPIHLGHLAGAYLPADIYTRHLKLLGEKVIHISGSDEHGVAIMLNAKKEGKNYKSYVDYWHSEHKKVFDKFNVNFDFFGQTSESYHAEEVIKWFDELYKKELIEPNDNQQLHCKACDNHLPDRFVEGTCYKCGYTQARGDECPNCGIWIDPVKLIEPVCKICGSNDIEEITVTQWYLKLSKCHEKYRAWFESKKNTWRKTVYPFVDSLTRESLHDRAITRDLDWGIDVPLPEAAGKKLYVWFDAPIGYVSNTKQYLEKIGSDEDYLKDWWKNDDTEIIHFLAKDNIIFHAVIFPVMGMESGRINPPTDIPANQYLNLEGKQFSKSTGWYIDIDSAFEQFGADAIRYYLISILPEQSDSSFTWRDFAAKINGELANNIGNLINRCLKFAYKNWETGLDAKYLTGFSETEIGKKFKTAILEHKSIVDGKEFKKGIEQIMSMGQMANTFFSDLAPWAQFKADPNEAEKTIALTSIQIMTLGVLLSPYVPGLSKKILSYFDIALTDTHRKKIYSGELEVFDELFANGMKITEAPKALVPKIDEKIISKLEEDLRGKAEELDNV
ncbi:MAG: methionine--tRNA ligase [Epsilonproteobacteria bacterium]|nr:MAG: methionine--tRNA ligase [Campylobacterota bacterium]RLA64618.1 MAG: methionine--tRNA ligase [Campylobacterota bacterium]